jgi:ligand-binding SRPBCC domain-containing protein
VKVHVLERSQRIERPAEEAFEFFAEARNLEVITPPWLRFEVVGADPMREGALIDYRLTLHRVPIRWRTRITTWEPPTRFVDVQLTGPYALWEHTHTFEPAAEATVIHDRVRYALPFGPLGTLAHALFVRRDVERIFDFRRRALEARL